MQRSKLLGAIIILMVVAILISAVGCSETSGSSDSSATPTVTVVKPDPEVDSTSATTSGNEDNYYATLSINVKNNGASGIVLVTATVTQNEETTRQETSSFIKKGETRPFELTFPLVWKGGDFTYDVEVSLP